MDNDRNDGNAQSLDKYEHSYERDERKKHNETNLEMQLLFVIDFFS